MAIKDKAYEKHMAAMELDRPKKFKASTTHATADYVRQWCAENGLKHDAETERWRKAKRAKRIAGPKGKLP
mgnify:CR=1 FL=1